MNSDVTQVSSRAKLRIGMVGLMLASVSLIMFVLGPFVNQYYAQFIPIEALFVGLGLLAVIWDKSHVLVVDSQSASIKIGPFRTKHVHITKLNKLALDRKLRQTRIGKFTVMILLLGDSTGQTFSFEPDDYAQNYAQWAPLLLQAADQLGIQVDQQTRTELQLPASRRLDFGTGKR
ncbi:hypothetical protein HJC99_05825 [Candidatus Saccharibacteria bacterium]|nr:hypothetical protein [Candidatus Saccharibacteria bacterium]